MLNSSLTLFLGGYIQGAYTRKELCDSEWGLICGVAHIRGGLMFGILRDYIENSS